MKTIAIQYSGNIDADLRTYFNFDCVGYHTQKWIGGYIYEYTNQGAVQVGQNPDRYEGYVQNYLDIWFMTEETAKAINEKILKVGDVIILQDEAPAPIENKMDASFDRQYNGMDSW